MKKVLLLSALLTAMAFGACNKSDEATQPTEPEVPVTPQIPASFGWETLGRVDLSIESPVKTAISIYSDADCKSEGILAQSVLLEAGVAELFPLTLPTDAEYVYVKYPAASGKMDVVKIAVNPLSDDREMGYKFPDHAVSTTFQMNDGFSYWHNSGVIMVEDRWPNFSIADADFNDLVMEYDMKLTECNVPANIPAHGYKEGITLTLDIRGVGSAATKKAGFQFLNLDPSLIENVETIVYEKSGQGVMTEITDNRFTIEVDKSQAGRVIIYFDGLNNLVQGKHYQTTKGDIIAGKPMIRAYIKLSGAFDRTTLSSDDNHKQVTALRTALSDTYSHDFFMVLTEKHNSAELHQRGFEPTYRYTTYAQDLIDELMRGIYYLTRNNEVWVLKLPVGTRHAYDRVSLFEAYPDLATWTKSAGLEKPNWYRTYDEEMVAPLW